MLSPDSYCLFRYDQKADIFSLGVVLFEMWAPPFTTTMERAAVLGQLTLNHEQQLHRARQAQLAAAPQARDPLEKQDQPQSRLQLRQQRRQQKQASRQGLESTSPLVTPSPTLPPFDALGFLRNYVPAEVAPLIAAMVQQQPGKRPAADALLVDDVLLPLELCGGDSTADSELLKAFCAPGAAGCELLNGAGRHQLRSAVVSQSGFSRGRGAGSRGGGGTSRMQGVDFAGSGGGGGGGGQHVDRKTRGKEGGADYGTYAGLCSLARTKDGEERDATLGSVGSGLAFSLRGGKGARQWDAADFPETNANDAHSRKHPPGTKARGAQQAQKPFQQVFDVIASYPFSHEAVQVMASLLNRHEEETQLRRFLLRRRALASEVCCGVSTDDMNLSQSPSLSGCLCCFT